MDEEAAVDRAVLVSNSELRNNIGLGADGDEHLFICVTGGDEDDFIFAQLGLVALVSHRPVLEGAVAMALAVIFIYFSVFDALGAGIGVIADFAEGLARLAL